MFKYYYLSLPKSVQFRNGRTFFYANGTSEMGKYVDGTWVKDVSADAPQQTQSKKTSGNQRKDYDNGDYYIGELKNDTRHGHGTFYWKNGDLYEGEWKNGKMHGQGELHWTNGDWYKGEWKNDKRHGQGVFYSTENKRTDKGEYVNGIRKGKGRMEWETGGWYEGTWNDSTGKLNGKGVYHYANGTSEKGKYVDGTWVKDIK
jgi:hypothetical protein